ncbi:plasmid partitioning protein RepB [Fulvimarina sp. MAC3]|uniref:plasmid partitioning protein RepB n=1 Tax=Fulvimarina sp. MAC3 TaxID=3148887 RepID=UPI0031FC1342
MVKRKDALRALLSGGGETSSDGATTDERTPKATSGDEVATPSGSTEESDKTGSETQKPLARLGAGEHMRSGAINAMRESWGELRREAEAAKTLREEIAGGGHVVLIDPEKILPSPISDRLARAGDPDAGFDALKASIEASGQAVPVLLRPHSEPEKAARGFFETAYGHRRVRAARELGLQVRAIVRPLTDEELILSQGRENAERRDLSFIERALFARTLEERGFPRETIRAALSIDNTQLTRLLQVATRVPETIVRRIGAAPKAGRPRWGELGEMIAKRGGGEIANEFTARESFTNIADSDARFRALLKRMTAWSEGRGAGGKKADTKTIADPSGEAIATIRTGAGGKPQIALTGRAAGEFSAFLAERLPDLFEEFRASSAMDGASGETKPDGEGAD